MEASSSRRSGGSVGGASDPFDIPAKGAPIERLKKWRQAPLVLNASRRYKYTFDLKREEQKEEVIRKIRAQAHVTRAAFRFQEAGRVVQPKEITEETRCKSMSSSAFVSHSVLAASQRTSAPKSFFSEHCKHCGKTGHLPENCFSLYPEKLADYRARRAARGRGTGSTPRGSVSIAAASPVNAPSSSWVLDSGASFHVTSDQSQLVACKPVTDGAHVQTTDGPSKRESDWDWPSP